MINKMYMTRRNSYHKKIGQCKIISNINVKVTLLINYSDTGV